jgi:hypothetical protein
VRILATEHSSTLGPRVRRSKQQSTKEGNNRPGEGKVAGGEVNNAAVDNLV